MTKAMAAAVRIFCAGLVLTPLAAVPGRAGVFEWEIDETRSEIELVVPDQVVDLETLTPTIRLRNPSGGNDGPWNVGNVASVDGQLLTLYEHEVSIRFLPVQLAHGLASGSYRPNPLVFDPLLINTENPDGQFANTSTAPGVYGARVRASVSIITLDAAFINFPSVNYGVQSDVLPITSGSFDGTQLDVGFRLALVEFDGVDTLIGQPIPDATQTPIVDAFGPNLAAGATITSPDPLEPDLLELTLPIDVDLVVDVGGVPLVAGATGTLVAHAMPEPGAASLLASGGALLAWLDRRRRRQCV